MRDRKQDNKKHDDRTAPAGLGRWCDARTMCWSLVIPIAILLVLLVRAKTSHWGLNTSSARALRFDRAFKPKPTDPPDTDPAFDPEGDAARIRLETAAKAQAALERAAKVAAKKAAAKKKQEAAVAAAEAVNEKPQQSTLGAGKPEDVETDAAGSNSNKQQQQQQQQQQQKGKGSQQQRDKESQQQKQQGGGGDKGKSANQGNSGSAASNSQRPQQQGGTTQTDPAKLSGTAQVDRQHARRKTDVRFVVVPAHKCQLLDDPLANACMYGGIEKANEPECREATKGQTSNSYLPAFTRIAPYIGQYGVKKYRVAPVWDGSSEEARQEWQQIIDGADILIVDELAIVYLGAKIQGKKLIALQHDAYASMRTCARGTCAQRLLREKRLLAYLQHTALVPKTLNNANRVEDVVHYDMLHAIHRNGTSIDEFNMVPASTDKPAFTDAMLAKVYTIVPMIWRWRFPITCRGRPEFTEWMMKPLQGGVGDFPPFLPPLAERHVDISFYGQLRAAGNWKKGQETADELFKLHRQQLYDSLTKLGRDCPEISTVISELVDYDTFAQGLRNTKMFISPLGKAEASGKDYEAIISRAVLIKPMASNLESYPNIYEVNVTCVEVKADYSNLEAVVKDLLGSPERMQRIADTAYQRVLAHSSERPVARDIANTLMDIAEADDPGVITYLK